METKFNFNSQICTTREQSERLLALGLKKETADIRGVEGIEHTPTYAWSLHRLWELIPKVVLKNPALHLTMCSNSIFYCTEDNNEDYEKPFSAKLNLYDNIIDSIEWLIKEGYFPKEYLV